MTPIQTDREAVERLALRSDATAAAHKATSPCCGEDDPCVAPACHFGEVMRGLQDGAATLRALLAERDAALAAVEVARREEREACATAAQRFAVSEGWSNTSALRLRNAIRALPIQPMPEQEAENG